MHTLLSFRKLPGALPCSTRGGQSQALRLRPGRRPVTCCIGLSSSPLTSTSTPSTPLMSIPADPILEQQHTTSSPRPPLTAADSQSGNHPPSPPAMTRELRHPLLTQFKRSAQCCSAQGEHTRNALGARHFLFPQSQPAPSGVCCLSASLRIASASVRNRRVQ